MRKFGAVFIALSLIAAVPSYAGAKKANTGQAVKKSVTAEHAALFEKLKIAIFFVDNLNGSPNGPGDPRHPFDNLYNAAEHSHPGDVFYLVGTTQPYILSSTFTLLERQSLLSSSASLKVGKIEIPALTPNTSPQIVVETSGPGIMLTGSNQIVGCSITGGGSPDISGADTGIGIGGVGSSGIISSNSFSNLAQAIDLTISASALANISSNSFSNLAQAIDLTIGASALVNISTNNFSNLDASIQCNLGNGATANVLSNSFVSVGTGIDASSTSLRKKDDSLRGRDMKTSMKQAKRLHRPVHTKSSSSGGYQLLVEKNTFTSSPDATDNYAIQAVGGATLLLLGNQASHFAYGLICQMENVDIIDSLFTKITTSNTVQCQLATLASSTFDSAGGSPCLQITLPTGGAVYGEGNTFSNSTLYGLIIGNGSSPAASNSRASTCVELVHNKGINNPSYGADIVLFNETNNPSLFQVAVPNPANGKASLSETNDNASVLIWSEGETPNDNAVSYVTVCLGSSLSK